VGEGKRGEKRGMGTNPSGKYFGIVGKMLHLPSK
jgi:hypothetical protein